MDTPSPSPQEIKNREILDRVAHTLGIRIALPRASRRCPVSPGQLCWGWSFQGAEVPSAWTEIIRSRTRCFDANQSFGVLGFSNGGYLLMHAHAISLADHTSAPVKFLVSVGSEKWDGKIEHPETSRRVPMTVMIGKNDSQNYDVNRKFCRATSAARIEFDGGHELNETAIRSYLSEQIRPSPLPTAASAESAMLCRTVSDCE